MFEMLDALRFYPLGFNNGVAFYKFKQWKEFETLAWLSYPASYWWSQLPGLHNWAKKKQQLVFTFYYFYWLQNLDPYNGSL